MTTRRDILRYMGAGAASLSLFPMLQGCHGTDPMLMSYPPQPNPPVLGGDASLPWWMRGNYAPIPSEIEAFNLEVIGSIPPEINGCFLRNGPNPHGAVPSFWFLGDGMLHAVEFAQGKAISYVNRYIQTPSLRQDTPTLLSNFGNTSLVEHHGRLLALYEQGHPFEIELPTLSTAGNFSFAGGLASAMTAHPKICPTTGELLFFGYGIARPFLTFYVANQNGEITRIEEIDIPRGVMMHDFQITENYVIFFDLPLAFELVDGSAFPMNFRPEYGARMGVMPRHGSNSDVRWFDVETCYLFHSYNAYEKDDEIVVEASRFESFWEGGFTTDMAAGTPWQWRLNRRTGTVSEGPFLDLFVDFPSIDKRRQGKPYETLYALRQVEGTPEYPLHPDGIIKYNRSSGELDQWITGHAAQPDEALFISDPSSNEEDGGWLMSMVYNRAENRSEVVILDAKGVRNGPIAKVLLPRRVPFGFHGLWVDRSEIE